MITSWMQRPVLVTGGASFIGSHLCEKLIELGAKVTVADDFSSGRRENLSSIANQITIFEGDLKDKNFAGKVIKGSDTVFHLAASHGGRGYIETHPADCATNLALDTIVFEEATKLGVKRICFSSSACVYPTDIQNEKVLLNENMVSLKNKGAAFSDAEYGWAKLMGEMSLKAFCDQYGIKASSVRYFTAYGPRCNESHAIIAFIAKALVKQDPFEIWGDGRQTRNFTYVSDIVDATILAAMYIEDGSAVNAGTSEFNTVKEIAEIICHILNYQPENGYQFLRNKPVGPLHRAADTKKASQIMGWKPSYTLREGIKKTIDWYLLNTCKKDLNNSELEKRLMER